MATEVMMPQMGESIAEGTIVRWLKRVGDPIDRDEPLFEISTDKVDAEIPSPGAGVILEIRVKEGETVLVNSVVALIGEPGTEVASLTPAPKHAAGEPSGATATATPPTGSGDQPSDMSLDERRHRRSSPVVRRIAREHGVDVSSLQGTGISGRVTRKDILAHLEHAAHSGASHESPAPPPFAPGASVRIEKLSVMRKKIAEHMLASVRTSPHVFSVYEADMHRVDQLRRANKAKFEVAGAKLTYTAFIAKATVEAIRKFPFANASIDGDNVVYKRDINLGIAVALDAGLIVPVIRDAARLTFIDLCRAIQDLAQRARAKHLKVEDVQDGTFTITNPGIFGAEFGLPIINQPQVAILGVGAIEKRVIVVDDMIAIRPTCYLSLGFDHRLIDGADGGRFLQALKRHLEEFDDAWMQ